MMLRYFWMILFLLIAVCAAPPVWAEGSRNLFPNGATGNRANMEWRTSSYGGGLLTRRTLLKVYAETGDVILVASSAVGVGSGDIIIYPPNSGAASVSGTVGQENVPAPVNGVDFKASSQSPNGKITSRAQELAGPKSADGTQSPSANSYAPAYYPVTQTGIYDVVFYGPDGVSSNNEPSINGAIDIGTLGDANTTNNFGTNQKSSVVAWDVTVRSSVSSITDLPGRLFCSYLTMDVGGNGRNLYSSLYAVTTDGYQYTVALNGLDPYGFVIYGSQIGFYDSDGTSPLYHDVLAATNASNMDQLTSIQGGCSLSLPQYPLFFQSPDPAALPDAGVLSSATVPVITNPSFAAADGTNNTRIGAGGTFHFTSNISAIYDIVISDSSGSTDPTRSTNRRLRGVGTSGNNSVTWNGKDNSGNPFPVGTNYAVHATIHGGEYHFPLIDAENSPNGGPVFTMTSRPSGMSNPLGNSFGFYDDRGYQTLNTTLVGTPGTVLPGNGPPTTPNSDPALGFNTAGLERTYGNGSGSGFGDKKGLDLWTYFPSSTVTTTLNVQGAPHLLLVKRITAVNGVNQTGFDDDPGTTDDNSPYWPAPAATYLRGVRTVPPVVPGDELEYTIYFLDTSGPGTNITLADVLPAGTAFETTAYGAASGIALAFSASSLPTTPNSFLTNAADSDAGEFYSPGTQAPAAANPPSFSAPLPAASNTNGVVAVVLAASPATLPAATSAGSPTNSYGFIRFRVRIQ